MKQNILEVPFADLYQRISLASKEAKDTLNKEAEQVHYANIANSVAKEYASREDSFEGSLEEIHPFTGVDPKVIKSTQLRVRKEITQAFCLEHNLVNNSSWLLPQLAALLAKIPIVFKEGKVSSSDYLQHLGVDDYYKGIWALCTHSVRGDFVPKQYLVENRNYSSLVPLLLMPHKRYNNVNYMDWDRVALGQLIDPNLYSAMTTQYEHMLSNSEILDIRAKALTYASGRNLGSVRNAATSHKVYSLSGELKELPWLTQVMLFQIWCAHPINRTAMMVLDWKNWDAVPDVLIEEIFATDPKVPKAHKVHQTLDEDLPWNT